LQHGGGASLDAHLVFNADAVHIVARTRDGRLSFSLFAALERRHLQALNLHASAAVSSTQAGIAGLHKSIDARGARGRSNAEISLSQEEIAAMLGTRRQAVSRVLREMEATGAIHLQYGRISIVDHDKLDRLAPTAQRA